MKIKNKFLMLVSIVSFSALVNVNNVNVNADSIKNQKLANENTNNVVKYEKMVLGSKFNDYIDALNTANIHNSTYGNNEVYTESEEIPFNFFRNYPKTMKQLLTTVGSIDSNQVVLKSDIGNEPWETDSGNSDGNDLLQQLYGNDGRTIYYHMNATGKLADLYNASIQAWNGLGVINLVPTDSTDDNVIQFDDSQPTLDNDNSVDGLTNMDYYKSSFKMCDVHVSVTNDVVNKYNDYAALVVAEHEIGHALGFDHFNKVYSYARLNNGKGKREKVVSLMNAMHDGGSGYSTVSSFNHSNLVGAREQYKLMQMYNLSVMPGYYVYPEINSSNDDLSLLIK